MLHGKEIDIIVAIDKHGLIGKTNDNGKGDMPWPWIQQDMMRFQNLTTPHTVVIGRKTWESLPKKKRPLPGRENIILSKDPHYKVGIDGVLVATTFEEAVRRASRKKVFAIGGFQVYQDALPLADILYITYVLGEYKGDVFFPPYDKSQWNLKWHETLSAETATGKIQLDFTEYTRIVVPTAA